MKEFNLVKGRVVIDEKWKWIEGYEGLYEISTNGNVRNNFKQRIRTFETKRGTMVKLHKDGFSEVLLVPLLMIKMFYQRCDDYAVSAQIVQDNDVHNSYSLF